MGTRIVRFDGWIQEGPEPQIDLQNAEFILNEALQRIGTLGYFTHVDIDYDNVRGLACYACSHEVEDASCFKCCCGRDCEPIAVGAET